jgi:hypothetical protein
MEWAAPDRRSLASQLVSAYASTCIAAYAANYTTAIAVGASAGFGRQPPADYASSHWPASGQEQRRVDHERHLVTE